MATATAATPLEINSDHDIFALPFFVLLVTL